MSGFSANKNWRESSPHLDLLSKFLKCRDITQVMEWQYLREALKGQTKSAIEQFIQEGMLIPCSIEECLTLTLKVPELKESLKEHGVKVSGNKAELIGRLVEFDVMVARNLIGNRQIMKCSPGAVSIVDDYKEQLRVAESEAKASTFLSLTTGNIKEAFQEYARFIRKYQSPNYAAHPYEAEELELILTSAPDALSVLEHSNIRWLQVAFAMSRLWRDEKPIDWLSSDFKAGLLEPQIAFNFLERSLEFKSQLNRTGDFGKLRIEFNPYDIDSCELCKRYDGMEFTENELPNMPLRGCKSEKGCQCRLEYVWDDSEVVDSLSLSLDIDDFEGLVVDDPIERLGKAKKLLDQGLITQEEYDTKKEEILRDL